MDAGLDWPEAAVIVAALIGVVVALVKYGPTKKGGCEPSTISEESRGVARESLKPLQVCQVMFGNIEKGQDDLKAAVSGIHRRLDDILLEIRKS